MPPHLSQIYSQHVDEATKRESLSALALAITPRSDQSNKKKNNFVRNWSHGADDSPVSIALIDDRDRDFGSVTLYTHTFETDAFVLQL